MKRVILSESQIIAIRRKLNEGEITVPNDKPNPTTQDIKDKIADTKKAIGNSSTNVNVEVSQKDLGLNEEANVEDDAKNVLDKYSDQINETTTKADVVRMIKESFNTADDKRVMGIYKAMNSMYDRYLAENRFFTKKMVKENRLKKLRENTVVMTKKDLLAK